MTIREKLIELHKDFAEKSEKYLKANDKLAKEGNGFFDKQLLDDLATTKKEWQTAANAYHLYLSQIVANKVNVDAEM